MATNYDPVTTTTPGTSVNVAKFPYPSDIPRLQSYDFNEQLFFGTHFDAFAIKMSSDNYGKEYAKMRYVVANFAGLISKVIADLLFIEPPKIQVEDPKLQEWIDALLKQTNFRVLCYESALQNSYLGDSLFKIRIGKLNATDEQKTILISDQTPKVYFPQINPMDVKAAPLAQELAWIIKIGSQAYLRKEIHKDGHVYNEIYSLKGGDNDQTEYELGAKQDLSTLNIPDLVPDLDTKIKESLLIHIPNWRAGNRHYGISDYYDLQTLFYALNNRITKTDNILDQHSDPILAIPQGILDEDGKVKKSKLGLIERPEGTGKDTDPTYITWDASLENAYKEIEKLIELTFMMSETSPDILGMGQGQSDSGRALKYKLLRTIAKAQRKQLYYTQAIKDVVYRSQLLAKAWNLKVDGLPMPGEPEMPEIIWSDGLPADMTEMIDDEVKRIDAALTTTADAIARLDDITDEAAEKKAKEIKAENKVEIPPVNTAANANNFGNNDENSQNNDDISPKNGKNPINNDKNGKNNTPNPFNGNN